ncbi:MAG: alpha/beta hydrolase [Actinobacteria bacterium]|nr:MAG: alpha/beta hydrolase [Actinomycetota bacterium]
MDYQRPIFLFLFGVILLFLLFAVYAVYLYFNQSKYVYFPTSDIAATPSDAGLFYEDIMLKTSDGINISGWYIPTENQRGTILFFHGNGGNISHRIEFIEMFYELNLSTFIIDYRGYGKSEGKPSEEGTYLDAEAAWDYVVDEKKINPSRIIIYGRSLGAPIGTRLAEKHKPATLILDSTFTSIKDISARLYPFLPVKRFFKFEYNTIEYLKGVDCPVLIIHSRDDSYIPFSHAERLFEVVDNKKELVETFGDHNTNFIVSREDYKNSIDFFINRVKE